MAGSINFSAAASREDKIRAVAAAIFALSPIAVGDSPTDNKEQLTTTEERLWEYLGENLVGAAQGRRFGSYGWAWFEDFDTFSASALGGGWSATTVGSSAIQIGTPATANQYGIIRLSTSASATGNPALQKAPTSWFAGGGITYFETAFVCPDVVSDGGETYSVAIGFGDVITGPSQTDGIYLVFDPAISTTNWVVVTAAGGIRTQTITALAFTAGATVKFSWVTNDAGTSVVFALNGSTVATHTQNIPNTSANVCGAFAMVLKSLGTGARRLDIDYMGAWGMNASLSSGTR